MGKKSKRVIFDILSFISCVLFTLGGIFMNGINVIAPWLLAGGIICMALIVIVNNWWFFIGHFKRQWLRIFLATCICLLVSIPILISLEIWVKSETEELAKTPIFNGSLFPGNEPTPEYVKEHLELNNIPPDDIVLVMGKYSFAYFSNINDNYVLSDGRKPFIEIGRRSNGSITISTTVIDSNNNKVATIINNEFDVSHDFSFNPQRPNSHTLIVRDAEGNEVLNMNYLNEKVIRISGRFLVKGQSLPVIIDPDGIITFEGEGLTKMIFRDTGRGLIILSSGSSLPP